MMINIYKLVESNGEVISEQIDTWDNGKFKKSSDKMTREEVLDSYNRGYNFTSEEG